MDNIHVIIIINYIVVALMAAYVIVNERRLQETHDRTVQYIDGVVKNMTMNMNNEIRRISNEQISKKVSFLDIYIEDRRNPSGEYIIYQREHAVRVYCSFEGDYGFTFISRKSAEATIDVNALYSTRDFAKIRVLHPTGWQTEALVENLLSFQNLSKLFFAMNSHENYKGPSAANSGLHPYLFLGFLPIELAKNQNSQGYRVKDMDFQYPNCDGNPNSYITFFFNPKLSSPGETGSTNIFMTRWITSSLAIDYPKYMDSSFYMDWEMHMGGCGGFLTSSALNTKASLGLPFGKFLDLSSLPKLPGSSSSNPHTGPRTTLH
ncbi:unnamed protein product [Mytilus edulis]|uniref:Uncharacterized protein n=1 Tax=Mytilus edulis TaxID=6550 RepID=A0A8S3UJ45_MYTED|nr:unnamed protein product [Mytilus edulis]